MSTQPKISILIPVYNEEGILRSSVVDLIDRLKAFDFSYELVLAENGSRDATVSICEELSQRFPQVRFFSVGSPGHGNYGEALRQAILDAHGEFVFCDEIDLCDTRFYARALPLLERGEAELVIGSKLADGAKDERPLLRHAGSLVINGLLRVALGFKGTDTHGLKAFRREPLLAVAKSCVVDKDLFASEFVIRAERAHVPIIEIPVRIQEKRAPSIHLLRRVPNVLKNLGRLVYAIRIKG
ncbi:MAG TPA: glycosyltransferase [Polyangiales bacterium]|jgi:glycosyltransferase involved in cell wall biosynthesis|nr:glycosyltransferase [Polyangiales bacterium]